MKDKELLIKAIDDYTLLTPAYRKVLQILVKLSVDGRTIVNIPDLSKFAGVSQNRTYIVVRDLAEQEIITIIKSKTNKLESFRVRLEAAEKIVDNYLVRQKL